MANRIQIEKYLKLQKLPYKIIDLKGEVFRVEDVVKAGVNPGEVVKTLVVATGESDKIQRSLKTVFFVALAVRGNDRVDFKRVRRLFGSKSELATAEEVQKVVGVPVGAVCPILIGIPLYFDRKVMGLKNVNLGSGDLTKGLEMKLEDLLKAVGDYQIADLV